MKNIMSFMALSSLFIFSMVLLPGCDDDEPGTGSGGTTTVTGCTDVDANNFNSEATEDDGSCSYDRDAFLGDYLGTFACDDPLLAPVLNSDSLTFEVKEPVDASEPKSTAYFSLLISGFPVDLESTVMGNTLTMSDTIRDFVIPDVDLPILGSTTITADIIGNGSATVMDADGTIDGSIDLEMLVTEPISLTISDNCLLFGNKK